MRSKPPKLREKLNRLAEYYDRSFLDSDPIQFPHRYKDPRDREIVAFIAAALAYGNVKQIRASVERVLLAMQQIDASPHRAILKLSVPEHAGLFAEFKHRFNDGRDMVCLLYFLQQMLNRCGSIEGFFTQTGQRNNSLRERLESFTSNALRLDSVNIYNNCDSGLSDSADLPDNAGVRFFFTNPSDGSACKRLCMFLRWVVRRDDGVDLGLWTSLSPAQLMMPLDTHTTRICYFNGLSPSPFATWRNAEFVTNELRRFDANDPVRYDFALSRLGILRVRGAGASVRTSSKN
ncbi:MAG: TIGR02757 family protein [Planctomycetota bacterium]